MSKIRKQIKEATNHFSLSKAEKERMREQIVSYMEYKPIRKTLVEGEHASLLSYFRIRHFSGAFMIAALVLSSTFGVTFAAGDALPGDLLYGVKVNINEEIKTVFLSSEASRIAWERERAERRLVEASQLAAEGRFDDKAQEKVSKLFKEHTDAMFEQVLAYEEVDPVLAAEASNEFEDSLETHEAVLARILVESEEEPDENALQLVEQVRSTTLEAEKISEDAEEKIDMADNEDAEVDVAQADEDKTESANMKVRAAHRAQERSEELLREVETLIEALEPESDLKAQAQAQVDFGKTKMEEGEIALQNNDLGGAYSAYKTASASFQKVIQLLEATELFAIEIYPDEIISEEEVLEEQTEQTENETVQTTEVNETDAPVEVIGEEGEGISEEVETVEETKARLDEMRAKAEETITEVRTMLLTQEGFDVEDVDEATQRIKDAQALVLRGEIAMVLEDYDRAEKLYLKAVELSEIALQKLRKEAMKDKVKGVMTEQGEEVDEVTLTLIHEYRDGVHTYSGSVEVANTCETLEGYAVANGLEPKQISLQLAVNEMSDGANCIEVSKDKAFAVKAEAGEGATLKSVTVNGEEVEWELTEGVIEKELNQKENEKEGILEKVIETAEAVALPGNE